MRGVTWEDLLPSGRERNTTCYIDSRLCVPQLEIRCKLVELKESNVEPSKPNQSHDADEELITDLKD